MKKDKANTPPDTCSEDFLCPVGSNERNLRHILIDTMNQLFFSTIRVDLKKNTAMILQSVDSPKIMEKEVSWAKYLNHYSRFMKTSELDTFSAAHLSELHAAGHTSYSKELPYDINGTTEWLTITAYLTTEEEGPYATVIVRKSSGEHLLRSIIDLYVYSTCDYFIYLDAKNNSYTSFSRSDNGTPLPPAVCTNYSAEIVKYANDFVVPEDREKVIVNMGLPCVLETLEHQPIHSFTCGILDPVRGYTRKRLTYQYYSRDAQMILLSRTDITDVYLEEQKNRKELQSARQMARMDALTGLYNLLGTVEEITRLLENAQKKSALLFIDLDNFKTVNDTLGHAAGDDLLRRVAEVLRANTQASDLVGRIGGDEFLVFFHDVKSTEEIKQRAQRLHQEIYALSASVGISVSCSTGIAISPEDGTDYTSLMKHADNHVYQAKSSGKNQFSIG